MDLSEKSFSDLVGSLKPWIPWRPEPSNVSRDFWMPDHSCRVCYDCDSHFTFINRRHHCRHCGRVFCAKCTSNWVPAQSSESGSAALEECKKVRVCNFCFKQWEQGLASADNGIEVPSLDLSTSPSSASLVSSPKSISPKSTGTVDSNCNSFVSVPPSLDLCDNHPFVLSPDRSAVMDMNVDRELVVASEGSNDPNADIGNPSPCQRSCLNRDDVNGNECRAYQLDNGTIEFPEANGYYAQVEFVETAKGYSSHRVHLDGETPGNKNASSSPLHNNLDSEGPVGTQPLVKKAEHDIGDESESSASLYPAPEVEAEPVDFENNGLLWLPPEPEDEEDEREALLFDDDDEGDTTGEWGYLRSSSSFGSGEHRIKDRSNEEHKKAVKNVVDGHFRALVAQLLQVENLLSGEEDERESWLEIITSLSWEAATLLKPDTSKGGGMDPGGYVKVKCIASGCRSDSMVVKGVVCKKNVAHRRMTSKIDKARLLILGGALEYQRVSNALSSFDTLLQQEMDHLKMAVAKIDAHQPDVLLVEKSVSRFAQEYLLAKDISLVLNIKRPLLERVARCTGGQIVPSIDHLSSQKLGYCDMFHVERFLEEHGTAGQGGKKLVKTLMYFEGCPKPLGCTILLRGANGDELKKVKHVVQYGVFAAYHLALETSFLADEGASLPALPLNSPITVALPDKPSSIDRSISTIPGYSVLAKEKTQESQASEEPIRSNRDPTTASISSASSVKVDKADTIVSPVLPWAPTTQETELTNPATDLSSLSSLGNVDTGLLSNHSFHKKSAIPSKEYLEKRGSEANNSQDVIRDQPAANGFEPKQEESQGPSVDSAQDNSTSLSITNVESSEFSNRQQDINPRNEQDSSKEEFPPSPSDHQSILVSLSSRCVWKGTVCERSHLFRIKYYGNFDKPLGRFLRDHLFDQSYRCRSCDMPSEAHVHCYTHRQGTLTISVKKLTEILLPGEKDGKIWMWHRCLRCPRTSGFPPATRRIVMSDAAWGLSFGKFLELSFSNHAAASRVASCGHSLHRDCLRFYGFGKMVACFRYASIDVHSVYLPPHKLNFNYEDQDWIRKELNEVVNQAELLFAEVFNALSKMAEKRSSPRPLNHGMKASESRRQLADLELMLQKEKIEFEESLQNVLKREVKKGQPVIDILEINRLRRQLLFQSYMWDHRLIYTDGLGGDDSQSDLTRSNSEQVDRISTLFSFSSLADMNISARQGKGHSSYDPSVVDGKLSGKHDWEGVSGTDGKLPEVIRQVSNVQKARDQGNGKQVSISAGVESDSVGTETGVVGTLSDGRLPRVESLSDTLDAAWRGDNHSGLGTPKPDSSAAADSCSEVAVSEKLGNEENRVFVPNLASTLSSKGSDYVEDSVGWLGMPFISFYRSLNKNFLGSAQKLNSLSEHNPVYVSSFRDMEHKAGARLLLPVGVNDTVIPIYDDEPTSIISYALVSPEYLSQLSDEGERVKESGESTMLLHSVDSGLFQSLHSFDEMALESYRSMASMDDSSLSISSSRGTLGSDPTQKALHVRVSFGDEGPLGKVKYTVTSYYAKRFDALRRICCPSEIDFVRSLSRCKKWGAQGGKSNVFFAKTLDDRFIIKQVTKTELESFTKFAPEYFKYLSESIGTGSPTCLAKILGIYQVTSKHLKGGKELKMDVLVMENLLFARKLTRLYDLKGSSRSRYNPDSSGSNKVLLDQNLIEAMPTSPIFVGNKAKRLLERAVWNDTSFLASIDVMDYSLLVGVDEENHELVLGIIDFMRQYTWDKHLETWVKASGILGGPKNASPTVISPKQYKKRFRKAMTTYFLMVPDQWSPPSIIQSKSQTELSEETNAQGGAAFE